MKTLAILVVSALALAGTARAQQPLSDLLVENAAPAQSAPDTDVTFSVTLTNLGPDPAATVVLDVPIPAGMTFVSLASAAGWACSTPAVGSAGTAQCTLAELAASTPAAFALVAHIDAAAAPGVFFTSVASATTATFDPTAENDSSAGVVQTPPPPASDVLVMLQGPSGSNPDLDVSYAIHVLNGGPGEATHFTLQQTIPGDMVVVSFTQLSGPAASCSSAVGAVTCTLASLPASAALSFALVGHIPAATADGTQYQAFATVSADYDPNSENDQHTSLLCIQQDSCSAGACNDSVAVVCPAPDQCHDQATCDPITGLCPTDPPKADGGDCDDGDGCTQQDDCISGVCTGSDPVVCPAAGLCQVQGSCDPGTGLCDGNTHEVDGTLCDDANACTASSSCQTGTCTGSATVSCPVADQCEVQGACNPLTGGCAANAPKFDGAGCDDDDWCTVDDNCQSGACTGAARNCDDGDACTADSCASSGECVHAGTCDAGATDAAAVDDSSVPMAGSGAPADASTGKKDAGVTDSGDRRDAGRRDAGRRDAGGRDAGDEDERVESEDCSCRIGPGSDRAHSAWPFALAFAALLATRVARNKRRPPSR